MALTTSEAVTEMLRWGAPEKAKFEAQLNGYIAAASEIVEAEAGPFEPRTIVHVADGGPSVTLPFRANAVVSVTVDDSPVTGWVADLGAGIVYGPFPRGRQNVVVQFTTGFEVIPASVTFATTSLVAHMWAIASQRGPGLPEDYTSVPTGFLVPNVVKEALAPFKTLPGFA